jgi:hypothetical protein
MGRNLFRIDSHRVVACERIPLQDARVSVVFIRKAKILSLGKIEGFVFMLMVVVYKLRERRELRFSVSVSCRNERVRQVTRLRVVITCN